MRGTGVASPERDGAKHARGRATSGIEVDGAGGVIAANAARAAAAKVAAGDESGRGPLGGEGD